MVTAYLCGAVVIAAVVWVAVSRFADPRVASGSLTRVAGAVVAGATWPILVVGALQALLISLLVRWLRSVSAAKADEQAPLDEHVQTGDVLASV